MAETRRKLEKNLSNDRYQHTLGIAYTATALAMCYQVSIEDAELAGLLHDCIKEYDKKESLSIAGRPSVRFSAANMAAPQIWYAIIGSVVAEKRYGIAKPEILSAIH